MKIGKIFPKSAALLLAVGVLMSCGCSVRFNTSQESGVTESQVSDVTAEPQNSDIIAKPTSNGSDGMEVTYGEFNQQYLYFLTQYGIEDDTLSDIADSCKEQRQTIIDSLILNKIFLQKAKDMNVPELTEEEKASAADELNKQFEEQAKYYGQKALAEEGGSDSSASDDNRTGTTSDTSSESSSEDSGDSSSDTSLSEEDLILVRGYQELDKMLNKCGITRDDLLKWNEEYITITKVLDELVKDISHEDAEKRAADTIKTLEDMYNSDDRAYYFQAGYDKFWVPEGARMIKHVLLGFDTETQTRITALRKDGNDDEADALRAEKAAEFTDKVAEVEKLLDDNVDFNTILLNYSADASGSSAYPDGYMVVRDDDRYVKEFTEASFVLEKIGDRTLCTSDYGVHIMIYASDAKPDEDAVKEFTENVLDQMRNEAVGKKTEEWLAEYNYEIDHERLRIEQDNSSSAS